MKVPTADDMKKVRDDYETTDEKLDRILNDLQLVRIQHIGMLAAMMLLGLGLYQVAKVAAG